MSYPADRNKTKLTGTFGPRPPIKLPNGRWSQSYHYGVDIAPKVQGRQENVYAVGRATVAQVVRKSDAGLTIILRLSDNSLWRYCHLSSVRVRPGQEVVDGEHIGQMGTTGNSTGVHLHLEKYPNNQLSVRVNCLALIQREPNPTEYAINGGGSKPAPKPTPTPAPSGPEVGPGGIKTGEYLLLKNGWRGYTYSNLTGPQKALLPTGVYRVWDIDNGSFRVTGHGRDAWVHGVKASKGNPVPAPTTPSQPAPKPPTAPKPSGGTVKVGSLIKLSTAWKRYNYSNLTQPFKSNLPAGTYEVKGIDNGNFLLQKGGVRGWVHSSAKSGLVQ